MSKPNDVGTVKVGGTKNIILTKFDGSDALNIYSQVKSFDIYESLDNACVTADFYLAEGIELVNEYPLGGEETISLTLQTPSRNPILYVFAIDSIIAMKTNDQSNLRSYVLRCTTKDFLKNNCTVYTKRYKDMKYHEAINEIVNTDWGVGKLKTNEQTKGKFDYVVNCKRPLQVIDIIRERAVSAENNLSSAFVFYEDADGYHFQTYEKLIKERKGGAAGKTFSYDTANRSEDYGQVVNVRNILSYETLSQGNQMDKVKRGAIRNQFREFDIHRGTYYKLNEYNNETDHKKFEGTDSKEDFNSAAFNGFTSVKPALTKMVVKDGLRPEMEHNLNLHYQRPFIERLAQQGVRIRVYGDTNLRVGDVIKLKFPEISGLTRAPKQNKIFSENYIVTSLKHRCDMAESNEFQHFCIMECRKTQQYKQRLG